MSISRTRARDFTEANTAQFRSIAGPDRFMRKLLGISVISHRSDQGAHRAFRTAVVVSALRCLITYLMVPVIIPMLSLSGWVAAPIGIALCVIAVINGIVAVRRFWICDHRFRWMYTTFMGIVFLILAIALHTEINRWMMIA